MSPSPQSTDRQIRVFISSTFSDMQEERDILIKKIFPQLRKLCEERAVTWTEVDLRWGITTEQAAEGKVLPLCLEEIHRCRPYFIGLLGGRYGSVLEPDSIPAELLESQPWLKQHLDHSVTELEILHGVFSEESMHGHAYFYFRDPKYLESVPIEKRQDFTTENAAAEAKLAKLKQKIRCACEEQVCELREGYANPEQLGEWILEDFIKLIDRLYPKDQTPDPIDQEASRHEAYARSRRLAFVGREDLLSRLNEHAAALGKPLVITGESGCGKSALLAEWVTRWRKEHPDDLIIQHFIGSTPDSADWQGLVRRILSELKRASGITDEIPVQPDALRAALNDWTVKAAGSRRVVLVLDALNQLAEDGAARQLGWLPVVFPTNVRLLVSSLPGESLDALRKRVWSELNVPLFARADIAPAALAYFKIFSKTPAQEILVKLESTPAACNALYLRAVLDELRQFGKHEELKTKAADYLSAPELPELFDRILTRWHEDFGKDPEHPDLVRRSLCFIACARFGLAEGELLDLLGKNGEPMPRRPWTPCYLAAENALVLRAGLLNFGHDHLRAAVRKRWLEDVETVRSFRQQLAEHFARIAEPADRKLDELPMLFRDLGQWEHLKNLLADIPTFLRFRSFERWKWELHGFWIPLRQHYAAGEVYREMMSEYENLVPDDLDLSHVLREVADFHQEAADHKSAEPLIRQRLAIEEEWGPDDLEVADTHNTLAQLLQATGRIAEAEELFRRVVAVREKSFGGRDPELATALANLAVLLAENSRLYEAEPLMRHALALREAANGPDHPEVARCLNNLAQLLRTSNQLVEAEPLMRRALMIDEQSLGPDHPDVARDLHNLAGLLMVKNHLAEAEPLMRRALIIDEQRNGPDHPSVATALNNLAQLLQATNRLVEAEPLMRRALAIDEKCFGRDHREMAIRLNNLAGLLQKMNRSVEAEPLMRQAIAIAEKSVGADHPTTGICIANLAGLLFATSRLAEAEPLFRRTLAIDEQRLGLNHLEVAADLQNLATLLYATGQFGEIESLLRRCLEILVKSRKDNGVEPPQLQAVVTFFVACSIKGKIGLSPGAALIEIDKIFDRHGLGDLRRGIFRELGIPI